jgi:hypothetical protein
MNGQTPSMAGTVQVRQAPGGIAPALSARGMARRSRGMVLPVVVVLLAVLTGVIAAQMKRAATDERIAANARESTALENAAQTTLRWCEWLVVERPGRSVMAAGTATTPAWRLPSNWSDAASVSFTGIRPLPGKTADSRCVIEDATCELQPPVSPAGMDAGGCNGIDSRWRKYRITARVRAGMPDLRSGYLESMAQSELRVFVQ